MEMLFLESSSIFKKTIISIKSNCYKYNKFICEDGCKNKLYEHRLPGKTKLDISGPSVRSLSLW